MVIKHLIFRNIFTKMLLCTATLVTESANANTVEPPKKNVEEWIKSWQSEDRPLPSGMMMQSAIIRRNNKIAELVAIDANQFNQLGILQSRPIEEYQFAIRLNAQPGKPRNNCLTKISNLFTCLDVDTVLDATAAKWTLFHKRDGKIITVTKAPPPKDSSSDDADYQEWVNQVTGYDGVALAQDGPYVLVIIPPAKTKETSQALWIANSETRLRIDPKKVQGAGLLNMVSKSGSYAIMEIVFSNTAETSIPLGTKLILEKSKALPKATPSTSEEPSEPAPSNEPNERNFIQ